MAQPWKQNCPHLHIALDWSGQSTLPGWHVPPLPPVPPPVDSHVFVVQLTCWLALLHALGEPLQSLMVLHTVPEPQQFSATVPFPAQKTGYAASGHTQLPLQSGTVAVPVQPFSAPLQLLTEAQLTSVGQHVDSCTLLLGQNFNPAPQSPHVPWSQWSPLQQSVSEVHEWLAAWHVGPAPAPLPPVLVVPPVLVAPPELVVPPEPPLPVVPPVPPVPTWTHTPDLHARPASQDDVGVMHAPPSFPSSVVGEEALLPHAETMVEKTSATAVNGGIRVMIGPPLSLHARSESGRISACAGRYQRRDWAAMVIPAGTRASVLRRARTSTGERTAVLSQLVR